MDDTAAAFPFRFRCQRSGNCCARPEGVARVGPADVARIAEHLGVTEAGFRSRYVAATGDRLIEGLGHRCVFLEDGGHTRCAIYPARPERGRSWPFWDEHRDPAALAEAIRIRPGIELDSWSARLANHRYACVGGGSEVVALHLRGPSSHS